ncbi:MAG: hypothetical protein EAZ98_22330 [Oscillatoriales cyanobacterium]|nr:MAG: hypothetical protein EAZ98_22330 [Oscillatoriales cyanobacterium]
MLKKILRQLSKFGSDEHFLHFTESVEVVVSKVLSLAMIMVIIISVCITAYLKKHVIQVELVIVTSLIAVSRKIIILDLEKKTAADLIGLATAIFALSISYLIVRYTNKGNN